MDKTILLVDDVQMFIEIQKEFLRGSEVEIMTASNGVEALDTIRRKTPDLVFMDLYMPDMDGATCCRTIKTDPSLPEVPVIMVTAMGKTDDAEYAFTAGCDDFLTKPLDRTLFLETARRYVDGIERREKRHPMKMEGVFSTSDESVACSIHDLSVGGAYVASDYNAIHKQVLKLYFTLPDGTRIECYGKVAWINRDEEKRPRGFGVQFALVPKTKRERLVRFIEATL